MLFEMCLWSVLYMCYVFVLSVDAIAFLFVVIFMLFGYADLCVMYVNVFIVVFYDIRYGLVCGVCLCVCCVVCVILMYEC